MQIEIEFTFATAKAPNVDDSTEDRSRFHVAVSHAGADLINNDIHSFAAGCFLHLVRPVWILGVDRYVRTKLSQVCSPFWIVITPLTITVCTPLGYRFGSSKVA